MRHAPRPFVSPSVDAVPRDFSCSVTNLVFCVETATLSPVPDNSTCDSACFSNVTSGAALKQIQLGPLTLTWDP